LKPFYDSINVKEARYEDHLLTISAAMDELSYRQPHGKRVAAIADALAVKFNSLRTTATRSVKPPSFTTRASS
jgi:hypothetical protein